MGTLSGEVILPFLFLLSFTIGSALCHPKKQTGSHEVLPYALVIMVITLGLSLQIDRLVCCLGLTALSRLLFLSCVSLSLGDSLI